MVHTKLLKYAIVITVRLVGCHFLKLSKEVFRSVLIT